MSRATQRHGRRKRNIKRNSSARNVILATDLELVKEYCFLWEDPAVQKVMRYFRVADELKRRYGEEGLRRMASEHRQKQASETVWHSKNGKVKVENK